MTDGKNTAMEREQISVIYPSPDESWREPQRDQLTAGDDAVLSLCQTANQLGRFAVWATAITTPTSICIALATYFLTNAMRVEGIHRAAC